MHQEIIIEPLTEQDLDEIIRKYNLMAVFLGFADYDEMQIFKYNAVEGMQRFGGSFIRALGYALAQADAVNSAKIIRVFKDDCVKHIDLYLQYMENENAIKN